MNSTEFYRTEVLHDIRISPRPILDQTTACNIATALIHSKLDYCDSLFLNLPANQLDRLQLVLNSAARAVTNTPKFHYSEISSLA
jgi:hypothetical protein